MTEASNAPLQAQIELDIADLKRGMKKAIKDAMRTVSQLAREWRDSYFPKDTGNLIGMTTVELKFKEAPFEIILTCKVDYASYVNQMQGQDIGGPVRWTNPETVSHFFDVWTEKVTKWFLQEFKKEVTKLNLLRSISLRIEEES